MGIRGQAVFLLLWTSLQTRGSEALPADVQPASLIFSRGILEELNSIRGSKLLPLFLRMFPFSSYRPFDFSPLPPSPEPLCLTQRSYVQLSKVL